MHIQLRKCSAQNANKHLYLFGKVNKTGEERKLLYTNNEALNFLEIHFSGEIFDLMYLKCTHNFRKTINFKHWNILVYFPIKTLINLLLYISLEVSFPIIFQLLEK